MTREHEHSDKPHPPAISRREFIIQLAALAGLLAACGPSDATQSPTPTSAPAPPTPTMPPLTAAPTAGPTAIPTVRPIPPRPEVIKFYPDAPSKIVHARHAGVWSGDELVPGAIRQMLDASITKLTGLNDAPAAWAALFRPTERIAIKVSTINTSDFFTHVPLVLVVAECLQEAGVPAEQIVIFDRNDRELKRAGYTINQDGPGVRCYGTDSLPASKYIRNWTVMESKVGLSDILLNCDALINMPILKHHNHSGVTFAMKNHFGTFDRPALFHRPRTVQAIPELNGLAPIKERARLVIGDALSICPLSRGGWHQAVPGDSILMSFDPVAHDTVGLQMLSEVMTAEGHDPAGAKTLADIWLTKSTELGLGTNDPGHMDLAGINLT